MQLINYYKQQYSEDDVIDHYSTDSRYPFVCDIYIKSENKFIELDGTWTHGPKLYDPNDQECINYLLVLQQKAEEKNSQYYRNVIENWTVRDPEKLKYVQQNNLNFERITYKNKKYLGKIYYAYSNGIELEKEINNYIQEKNK